MMFITLVLVLMLMFPPVILAASPLSIIISLALLSVPSVVSALLFISISWVVSVLSALLVPSVIGIVNLMGLLSCVSVAQVCIPPVSVSVPAITSILNKYIS